MSSRPAALVLIAVLALTAACGGGDDDPKATPKPAQTSLTGPGVEPSENFATGERFFDALAEASPTSMVVAEELVAPGSEAARYVTNLTKLVAGGKEVGGRTVTEDGPGRYRLCDATASDCLRITDVLLTDGKVSSFKIDGKRAGATK